MVVYLHACATEALEQPALPQAVLAYVVTVFPQATTLPLLGWFAV